MSSTAREDEARRFREVFVKLHADHDSCSGDEWLTSACSVAGEVWPRPIVWSRRNGPWRRVQLLIVGAAPGNAGGRGSGQLGAHGTRIPFGGDIAGANLDVLLASIGTNRNEVFMCAALNSLPKAGGGEPKAAELAAPVGAYPDSFAVLRDTILVSGPDLIACLGNVAIRSVIGALSGLSRMASMRALERAGWTRGRGRRVDEGGELAASFTRDWHTHWGTRIPSLTWLIHPSAQNMSPFAGRDTAFHRRMRETRAALRTTVRTLGWELPGSRRPPPADGIYALPEWRDQIAPYHERLSRLWRDAGI